MNRSTTCLFACAILLFSFRHVDVRDVRSTSKAVADTLHYPEETHFDQVRQLTFGGDNAEAY